MNLGRIIKALEDQHIDILVNKVKGKLQKQKQQQKEAEQSSASTEQVTGEDNAPETHLDQGQEGDQGGFGGEQEGGYDGEDQGGFGGGQEQGQEQGQDSDQDGGFDTSGYDFTGVGDENNGDEDDLSQDEDFDEDGQPTDDTDSGDLDEDGNPLENQDENDQPSDDTAGDNDLYDDVNQLEGQDSDDNADGDLEQSFNNVKEGITEAQKDGKIDQGEVLSLVKSIMETVSLLLNSTPPGKQDTGQPQQASRGQQIVRKDKDLMSDTGGTTKRRSNPTDKPPRDDVKDRFRSKFRPKDQQDQSADAE